MFQKLPTLADIQKATVCHQETVEVGNTPIGINVPIGAKTALLVFQNNRGIVRYAEGDTNLPPNINAPDGMVKELVGYEMRSFRAMLIDGRAAHIHVTYTK